MQLLKFQFDFKKSPCADYIHAQIGAKWDDASHNSNVKYSLCKLSHFFSTTSWRKCIYRLKLKVRLRCLSILTFALSRQKITVHLFHAYLMLSETHLEYSSYDASSPFLSFHLCPVSVHFTAPFFHAKATSTKKFFRKTSGIRNA